MRHGALIAALLLAAPLAAQTDGAEPPAADAPGPPAAKAKPKAPLTRQQCTGHALTPDERKSCFATYPDLKTPPPAEPAAAPPGL